ncbi:MAG TPA: hypothetical protein VF525_17165 [Pyrinomonadaceae bacterium]|jgi:hypothetical protein
MNRRLLLPALFVLSAWPMLVAAQISGRGGISTGSPKDKAIEDKIRSDEIERIKRDAEKPDQRTDPQFPLIKQDFERIQIINNEVLQADAPPTPAASDYARIAAAASEIKKRAARLKANLFPAGVAADSKEKEAAQQAAQTTVAAPEDLRSLLAELDSAIAGFVTNPMFQNLRVVNTQSSAQAGRDLERVIKLSGKLRQAADRKRKSGD